MTLNREQGEGLIQLFNHLFIFSRFGGVNEQTNKHKDRQTNLLTSYIKKGLKCQLIRSNIIIPSTFTMTQNFNPYFLGKSPLEIAAERGHSTLVKTLTEKGALQHLDDGKLF